MERSSSLLVAMGLALVAAGCGKATTGGRVGDVTSADTGSSTEPERDAGGRAEAGPAPDAGGLVLPLPTTSGGASFKIPGRSEQAIEVALPSPIPPRAPLILAFHGTGNEPSEGLGLAAEAAAAGAIVIAPRAGYRDGKHPADVDHDVDEGGSSWNLWASGPEANEDLRYVLALISSAQAAYGVDPTRVYTFGFSNGAFMAYFVAASLPDLVAGFAEASGGWTTDACPTRYGAMNDGLAFQAKSGPAPGTAVSCATLYGSKSPAFPTRCAPSASNRLRPPPLSGRVPFGYLAHYSDDDIVSVMWSCFLGDALGARAQVTVRFADAEGLHGHSPPPDFFPRAWAFLSPHTSLE